ncbi:MAG: hypothetical protein IPL54_07990 [Chitinophagaceae bacterium]|nr:hypothetical protein [Chitinophagaceae bacterium]
MKKLIIKITAATVFTLISFTGFAQQAADRKPIIDGSSKTAEPDKTSLPAAGPQIVAPVKALTVNEKPKPIVPGGEFKPMDTNGPVKNYSKNSDPVSLPPVKHDLQKKQ